MHMEVSVSLPDASCLLPQKSEIRQLTSHKLSLFKDITRLYNLGYNLTLATNERIFNHFWTLRRPEKKVYSYSIDIA